MFQVQEKKPIQLLPLIPQQWVLEGTLQGSHLSSSILVSREIKPKSEKEITYIYGIHLLNNEEL